MNRLEQQFWGQPTAHEELFIMTVHSHWCPCQHIKLKMPINIHTRVYITRARAASRRCFIFLLDTPISLLRSSEIQIHLEARNIVSGEDSDVRGRARRDLRVLSYFPSRPIKSRGGCREQGSATSSSISRRKNARYSVNPPTFRRIVCRDSLIQFSRSRLCSFRKYHFLHRLPFLCLLVSFSFSLRLRHHPPSATVPPAAISDNLGE